LKKLITFKDIDNARKTLGLDGTASMQDIKKIHRELILKFHPDRHNNSKEKKIYEEKVKEINSSYKIIINYCNKYPISFSQEKVNYLEEGEYQKNHLKRFYSGWVSKGD